MVRFFNANIVWNGLELSSFREGKFPLIRQCHVTYTTEEKCWLTNKLDCVKVNLFLCFFALRKTFGSFEISQLVLETLKLVYIGSE